MAVASCRTNFWHHSITHAVTPSAHVFYQKGGLDVNTARFYAAEIVEVLQYLRNHDIVHRSVV